MKDMYIYLNESHIEKYNGEILKRYVGNKLIKVIANPTKEDLIEFGYKHLIEETALEEKEGFYIQEYYEDGETITKKYRYVEIQEEIEEMEE